MKCLILGVNGMLGHVLFDQASHYGEVLGTSRKASTSTRNVITNVDATSITRLEQIISDFKPDFVINCIGIIKQLEESKDPIPSIKVNALFPHELSVITRNHGAGLIHLSTDCVFKGDKGNYRDEDVSDADDLYGRTKFLGEVGYERCVTLRTSIIGHELDSNRSLIDWFLGQKTPHCKGYNHAIYTGFPTIILSQIIFEKVIPHMLDNKLHGVFNLSSDPISKFDLLKLVAQVYGKTIVIQPDDKVKINRSLNSDKLRNILGFTPASWEKMIHEMHEHFLKSGYKNFKRTYELQSV